MAALANARRRLLARFGRNVVLRRSNVADLALRGVLTAFAPEDVQGDVKQGDMLLEIGNDEMAAANWPTPPKSRDQVSIDGRTWAVEGAWPVFSGTDATGWKLQIRGGQT